MNENVLPGDEPGRQDVKSIFLNARFKAVVEEQDEPMRLLHPVSGVAMGLGIALCGCAGVGYAYQDSIAMLLRKVLHF